MKAVRAKCKIKKENRQNPFNFKVDLHGSTVSHTTSLRQAYDMT